MNNQNAKKIWFFFKSVAFNTNLLLNLPESALYLYGNVLSLPQKKGCDMDTAVLNANSYWNVLKDLSNEVKLDLIARLSNSLLHKDKNDEISAKRFYGVWKDADYPAADDLNADIKSARKFRDDVEAF